MFLSLPNEIKLQIVSGLDTAQEAYNLARTCRTLWGCIDEKEITKRDAVFQRRWNAALRKRREDMFRRVNLFQEMEEAPIIPGQPLLLWAIESGIDIARIETIVDAYCDEFPQSMVGLWIVHPPPLRVAIEHNRIDVVELFLRKGCDVSKGYGVRYGAYEGEEFDSPCIVALKLSRPHIARFLLDEGAFVGSYTLSAAVSAGRYGMLSITKDILQQLKAKDELTDDTIQIAFLSAVVECTDLDIIDLLLVEHSALPMQSISAAITVATILSLAVKHDHEDLSLHLWHIYKRDHSQARVVTRGPNYLVKAIARSGFMLEATKEIHSQFPWMVPLGGVQGMHWTAEEELLRLAIGGSDAYQARQNSATVQYLLDSGCKVSTAHLEEAARMGDAELIDEIIRRGVSPQASSVYTPELTVLEAALTNCCWYGAFRLLHNGAYIRRDLPAGFEDIIRGEAKQYFFPPEDVQFPIPPLSADVKARIEPFEFRASMPKEPDTSVFALGKTPGTLSAQLFTLFQMILGADFLDGCN